MQGLHLTADLYECRCAPSWLTEAGQLGPWCVQAAQEAGLQVVNQLFHEFPATAQGRGGVTGTLLLAESHVCLHTWPELQSVTVDVYVCNVGGDHSVQARSLMDTLIAQFVPTWTEQRSLDRGDGQ